MKSNGICLKISKYIDIMTKGHIYCSPRYIHIFVYIQFWKEIKLIHDDTWSSFRFRIPIFDTIAKISYAAEFIIEKLSTNYYTNSCTKW